MTSFIINDHTKRAVPKSWSALCPFCKIIQGELNAWRVYEDELTIVILGLSAYTYRFPAEIAYFLIMKDILPLRRGHLLVIPKASMQARAQL
jgi:diadenosine tetraphosphate (Ap4A) HIT family hydrolase